MISITFRIILPLIIFLTIQFFHPVRLFSEFKAKNEKEWKEVSELKFQGIAECTGIFGGYVQYKTPEDRHNQVFPWNGFLLFKTDIQDIPNHIMRWTLLGSYNEDFKIGGIWPEGEKSGEVFEELLDWTSYAYSCKIEYNNKKYDYKLYSSRAYPQALYETDVPIVNWVEPDRDGPTRICYAGENGIKQQKINKDMKIDGLTEPWVLIWHHGSDKWIKEMMPDGSSMADVLYTDSNEKGLKGEYFKEEQPTGDLHGRTKGIHFKNLKLTRIDRNIDFIFDNKGPDNSLGGNNYSIRWTGKIKPEKTSFYKFYTKSDDGVRLWIDNKKVIENWSFHASTIDTTEPVKLEKGKSYDIKLEYFQAAGGAIISLSWDSVEPGTVLEDKLFDVPVLIVLENKPEQVSISGEEKPYQIQFKFNKKAGKIAAMPLFGITRPFQKNMKKWEKKVPEDIIKRCREWAHRLQAFPLKVKEKFTLDEESNQVEIKYDFEEFITMNSEWGMKPEYMAPLPPVAVMAKKNGYPVNINGNITKTEMDTHWGTFWYMKGKTIKYKIPLPFYIGNMMLPVKVTGDKFIAKIQNELDELIGENINTRKHYTATTCNEMRVLGPVQYMLGTSDKLKERSRDAMHEIMEDKNLRVEKETFTGQYWLSDATFWCAGAHFDMEWENGWMLTACGLYAYHYNDMDYIKKYYNKILGLYRYYQVVFDWPTSITFSLVQGGGANADGVHFAWQGMLNMARFAKEMGDEETYIDAVGRAAKQMLSLYAFWYAPQYGKDHDYCYSKGRYIPAEKAETRFNPDNWRETYTSSIEDPPGLTHWFVSDGFFWNNYPMYLFYHDFGLDEKFVRDWTMKYALEYHPDLFNGNIPAERGSGRNFGDDWALSHLLVRSVVLHQDPKEVYKLYQSCMLNSAAYSIHYAGGALHNIILGSAPIATGNIFYYNLVSHTYDARSKKQRIILKGRKDGETQCRIRCWKMNPIKVLVNGQKPGYKYDKKTDYLTINLKAKKDKITEVQIEY